MKPRVFIGSSVEAKTLCGALQSGLQHDARVSAWHQIFPLSAGTLDALLTKFSSCEFAIFVFSPDDVATIRSAAYAIARDNVLFEAGLFMGMHGKRRAFIVTPMGTPDFHIATDLLGFTTATYDPAHAADDTSSALGAAVYEIARTMKAVIREQEDIEVTSVVTYQAAATWPLKLNLRVVNAESVSVLIESESFAFGSDAPPAPNNSVLQDGDQKPAFKVAVNEKGFDVYSAATVLAPGKSVEAWVPFDPTIGEGKLKALLKQNKNVVGTWKYRCVWHTERPIARTYEREF